METHPTDPLQDRPSTIEPEKAVVFAEENAEHVRSAHAASVPPTLHRSLSLWNSLTIEFATVSPVAGLYAIIGVQTVVAGGG